jgi:hypothetical protein
MKLSAHLLPLLAAASLLGGCGRTELDLGELGGTYTEPDGAVITGHDPGLFVGTWTCPGTETFTYASGGLGPHSQSQTALAIFGGSSGDMLALTLTTVKVGSVYVDPDGGVEGCSSFTFVVSGSTATAVSGPSCSSTDPGNAATFTFKNGTFFISGTTADINMNTTVSPGPGSAVAAGVDSFVATCTRLVPDAG